MALAEKSFTPRLDSGESVRPAFRKGQVIIRQKEIAGRRTGVTLTILEVIPLTDPTNPMDETAYGYNYRVRLETNLASSTQVFSEEQVINFRDSD